jgi:adenylate cyclase
MTERAQCRLAAIVAMDVVEYSRMMGVDEVGTLAALRLHRSDLIDPAIDNFEHWLLSQY